MRALLMLSAALLFATQSQVSPRPDFSGRWILDPAKSSTTRGGRAVRDIGLAPPPREMIIRQDDTTMRVDARGAGDSTITIVFNLKGRKTNRVPLPGGRTMVLRYTSSWDGSKLTTTVTRPMFEPGERMTMTHRESRYLALDGTMVVAAAMEDGRGARISVYRRVAAGR